MLKHLLTHLDQEARRELVRIHARQLPSLAEADSGVTGADFELFAHLIKILEQQFRQAQKVEHGSRAFRSKEVELSYILFKEIRRRGIKFEECWRHLWNEPAVKPFAFSVAKKKNIRDAVKIRLKRDALDRAVRLCREAMNVRKSGKALEIHIFQDPFWNDPAYDRFASGDRRGRLLRQALDTIPSFTHHSKGGSGDKKKRKLSRGD